jgi:hypothetical protein
VYDQIGPREDVRHVIPGADKVHVSTTRRFERLAAEFHLEPHRFLLVRRPFPNDEELNVVSPAENAPCELHEDIRPLAETDLSDRYDHTIRWTHAQLSPDIRAVGVWGELVQVNAAVQNARAAGIDPLRRVVSTRGLGDGQEAGHSVDIPHRCR